MFESLLKPLASFMMANQTAGALIAGFIACAESMAIVGTIIPGSITMTLIGTLIGSGVLPISLTFSYIIVGAFIGDYLSYWVGMHYKEHIKDFTIVKKYIQWFDAGEAFIRKHGVKSIIIGRFFGPMRSMVPLVAGVLGMSRWKFILGAIPSVFLWAILYLTPGIILGAFALEMPADLAMQFIAIIITLLIIAFTAIYLVKVVLQWLHSHQQGIANSLWHQLQQHPNWLTTQLVHCETTGPIQVLKSLYAIILLTISISLLSLIVSSASLTHYDLEVFHFMQNIYTPNTYSIMVLLTFFGEKQVLIPAVLCTAGLLYWQQSYRCARYLFTSTLITSIIIELTKYAVLRPRPILSSTFTEPYSFPSGHTALATAIYVFMAMIVAHHLKPTIRHIIYKGVALLILCIGFSRLYIYAHWLSDILFGASLGLTIAVISSILYHRKPCNVQIKPVIMTFLLTFGGFYMFYAHGHYQAFIDSYVAPQYPEENLTSQEWWGIQQDSNHFRHNIWGTPIYPLNVQWLGSDHQIHLFLSKQHWKKHEVPSSISTRLVHLIDEPSLHILPLLPQKYLGAPPKMVYSISIDAHKEIVLKLWPSHITVDGTPLWLGSIYTNPLPDRLFSMPNKQYHLFNAHHFMQKYEPILQLSNLNLTSLYTDINTLPEHIKRTTWDKHILQLRFTSVET